MQILLPFIFVLALFASTIFAIAFGISSLQILIFDVIILGGILVYQTKILHHARKKFWQNSIEIAVLGTSGVGKTSFTAGLIQQIISFPQYNIHSGLREGVGYMDDDIERDLRNLAVSQKDEMGDYIPRKRLTREMVETELKRFNQQSYQATCESENIFLKILHKKAWYRLQWYDIPGSYFEEENQKFSHIKDILRRCYGIIFLLDSQELLATNISTTQLSNHIKNYFTSLTLRMFSPAAVDKFPLWIVFTKGDCLVENTRYSPFNEQSVISQYLSNHPVKNDFSENSPEFLCHAELLRKSAQILVTAKEHPNKIDLITHVVSIYPTAQNFYRNLQIGMGKFCECIWQQWDIRRRRVWKLILWEFCLIIFFLYTIMETFAYWQFSKLPNITKMDGITIVSGTEILQKLSFKDEEISLPSFYWQRRGKLLAQIAIVQAKLVELLDDKIENMNIAGGKFQNDLQLASDAIHAIEKTNQPYSKYTYHKEYIDWLKAWDKQLHNKVVLEKKFEFFQRIPGTQKQLRASILAEIKGEMYRELERSQTIAETHTGEVYYNARLIPLLKWYQSYGQAFYDLDEICYSYQNEHWDYCWQRFAKEILDSPTLDFEQKAEKLYEFWLKQTKHDVKLQTLGKFPPAIQQNWEKRTLTILQKMDENIPKQALLLERLREQIAPDLQQELESFQFDQNMRKTVQSLFSTTNDGKNLVLEELSKKIEKFKLGAGQHRPEMLRIWQERYEYFCNPQIYDVTLQIVEYGTDAKSKSKRWDSGILDSWYLYIQIVYDEKKLPVLCDWNKGDNFKGLGEIKIHWSPWQKISIVWFEADGDIDSILKDDVLLYKADFRTCLSILDARSFHRVHTGGDNDEYWMKYEIKNTEQVIPRWLLEIYFLE